MPSSLSHARTERKNERERETKEELWRKGEISDDRIPENSGRLARRTRENKQ